MCSVVNVFTASLIVTLELKKYTFKKADVYKVYLADPTRVAGFALFSVRALFLGDRHSQARCMWVGWILDIGIAWMSIIATTFL
jgi:hypothetical protein